jgi:uncharacterized membrane protein
MHSQKYLTLCFMVMCLWCFGIISPVVFHNSKAFLITKPFLIQVYSTVCHQEHEKSISFDGNDLFVCSRCIGIYLGLLIIGLSTLIFTKRIKNNFYLVPISSLVMLIDVSSSTFGIYNYSKPFALVTGLLLGSTISLFVLDQLNIFNTQNNYEK